jgi:23S rRNA pseudouridine955/2504/2580 synthase
VRAPRFVDEAPAGGPEASLRPPMGLSKADRTVIERMILYEDDDVLILNKPYGIAVQGGSKTMRHIDGLLAGMEDRFGCRVRLVHRLDRDTTGVLLAAKSRDVAAKLGRMFQTRSVQKIYWALLRGVPKPPQGKVDAALVKTTGPEGDRVRKAGPGEQEAAQGAVTHYSMIDQAANKVSWASLKPVTGRQHQLRVHMALLGCPILGDGKYDSREELPLQGIERKLHLHARRLVLPHPAGEGVIDVSAPLPEHMRAAWELLGFDPDRYAEERANN